MKFLYAYTISDGEEEKFATVTHPDSGHCLPIVTGNPDHVEVLKNLVKATDFMIGDGEQLNFRTYKLVEDERGE